MLARNNVIELQHRVELSSNFRVVLRQSAATRRCEEVARSSQRAPSAGRVATLGHSRAAAGLNWPPPPPPSSVNGRHFRAAISPSRHLADSLGRDQFYSRARRAPREKLSPRGGDPRGRRPFLQPRVPAVVSVQTKTRTTTSKATGGNANSLTNSRQACRAFVYMKQIQYLQQATHLLRAAKTIRRPNVSPSSALARPRCRWRALEWPGGSGQLLRDSDGREDSGRIALASLQLSAARGSRLERRRGAPTCKLASAGARARATKRLGGLKAKSGAPRREARRNKRRK